VIRPVRKLFPLPKPPTTAVSPDARRTSCASHGSQATGRRVAVHVSPIMMPRRSPTLAVAAGTAAAAQVTEPRRRYAVEASASPGMNSRA